MEATSSSYQPKGRVTNGLSNIKGQMAALPTLLHANKDNQVSPCCTT